MSEIDHYKVWIHIEPMQADGDPAGDDIDFERGCVGLFREEDTAKLFAQTLHDVGEKICDRLVEKQRREGQEFCSRCGKWKDPEGFHHHEQLGAICDDCWDERLR